MVHTTDEANLIAGAPTIPGLRFRHFRGESDFPEMVRVANESRAADGLDTVVTVELMARMYATLKNSDPKQDVIIAETNSGKMVAGSRVEWWEELDGTRIYAHRTNIVPEWRGKGLGTAILRYNESRLREIAASHPSGIQRFFDRGASDKQKGLIELLEREGYKPIRYWYDMVRPDLENMPDVPLPDGIEVRPVQPEHLRAIWEAEVEAFKDHWGDSVADEKDFERWKNAPVFQTELWQIAWEGDQVVGMVRNFIHHEANEKLNRKRGYTENISVRRAWRQRGIARALIARSFLVLKEQGMTEAALAVDAENPSGALRLYENLGFKIDEVGITYRKPMD